MRAIASPAAALTALAAAIVVLCTRCALLGARSHVPFAPWPSQAVDRGFTHAATGSRGGGWQVANLKVAFCHSLSISCVFCCFVLLDVCALPVCHSRAMSCCTVYCTL